MPVSAASSTASTTPMPPGVGAAVAIAPAVRETRATATKLSSDTPTARTEKYRQAAYPRGSRATPSSSVTSLVGLDTTTRIASTEERTAGTRRVRRRARTRGTASAAATTTSRPPTIARTTPTGGSLSTSEDSASVEPASTAKVASRSTWTRSTAVSLAALAETATGVANPRFCR